MGRGVGAALPVVAATALGLVLVAAVARLPGDAAGLVPFVEERLEDSGASNPVTAVLLNFRAYDTWLEIAVLLITAVAALAVRRRADLADVPAPVDAGPVVESFVRQAVPIVVLTAVLLLSVGTFGPGGAFQAGAMLGSLGVLLYLAGHRSVAAVRGIVLRAGLVAGVGAFVLAAIAPLTAAGALLEIPPGRATATILAVEIAVTASIAVTLAMLFVAAIPASEVAGTAQAGTAQAGTAQAGTAQAGTAQAGTTAEPGGGDR